jgi:mRNA interferase RelE/StbE
MDVIWQAKAVKQLKKIGNHIVQERILTATRGLTEFPVCSNVKRLVDHEPTHRLRVGIGEFCSMCLKRSASLVLKR